jgi:hypothetical protein
LLVARHLLLVAGKRKWNGFQRGIISKQEEANILKAKSCRDLEIYQLLYELAIKIHGMSLNLPK